MPKEEESFGGLEQLLRGTPSWRVSQAREKLKAIIDKNLRKGQTRQAVKQEIQRTIIERYCGSGKETPLVSEAAEADQLADLLIEDKLADLKSEMREETRKLFGEGKNSLDVKKILSSLYRSPDLQDFVNESVQQIGSEWKDEKKWEKEKEIEEKIDASLKSVPKEKLESQQEQNRNANDTELHIDELKALHAGLVAAYLRHGYSQEELKDHIISGVSERLARLESEESAKADKMEKELETEVISHIEQLLAKGISDDTELISRVHKKYGQRLCDSDNLSFLSGPAGGPVRAEREIIESLIDYARLNYQATLVNRKSDALADAEKKIGLLGPYWTASDGYLLRGEGRELVKDVIRLHGFMDDSSIEEIFGKAMKSFTDKQKDKLRKDAETESKAVIEKNKAALFDELRQTRTDLKDRLIESLKRNSKFSPIKPELEGVFEKAYDSEIERSTKARVEKAFHLDRFNRGESSISELESALKGTLEGEEELEKAMYEVGVSGQLKDEFGMGEFDLGKVFEKWIYAGLFFALVVFVLPIMQYMGVSIAYNPFRVIFSIGIMFAISMIGALEGVAVGREKSAQKKED